MRNNSDRLNAGSNQMPEEPVLPQTELEFPNPTELVEIPSKGRFYPTDHPLYKKESVEIKYMTAAEEDILTSKSLLKKGIAVERFLQKILIDQSIKLDTLLIGDKNAIIIASRITGYGADYEISLNCPSCGELVKHSFDLTECKVVECEKDTLEQVGATLTEKNTLIISLPKTKWLTEVKFLTGEDEKWLSLSEEKKKKHNLPESSLTELFQRMIISINENTDRNVINKAILNMPALDSRFLRTAYQKLSPNVDLTQDFICSECGKEQEVLVPIGPEFFWPQR
jgi:hypothetical protein